MAERKLFFALLVLLGVCLQSQALDTALVTVKDGTPAMTILLPPEPSEQERLAATELRDYLDKISGAEFAIESGQKVTKPGFVIGDIDRGKALGVDVSGIAPGGFMVRSVGDSIFLIGHSSTETVFAAHWFLETVLGVRWFTHNGDEYVPSRAELAIPRIDHVDNPAFEMRDTFTAIPGLKSCGGLRKVYNLHLLRQRVTGMCAVGPDSGYARYRCGRGTNCHTFFLYVPPKTYFEKHPEYFSLSGTRRIPRQLCFSNPQLRKLFTQRVLAAMAEEKNRNVFDVSQEDVTGSLCDCDACRSLVDKYKTPGAPLFDYLVELAAAVKEQFPDNFVHTLAYRRRQTEVPPTGMTMPDNVIVQLACIQNILSQPFDAPANRKTYKNLQGWSKISKRVWIWYYPQPYGPVFRLPFDSMKTFARDMKIFRRLGVSGVFVENTGSHNYFHDLCDLKQWVMRKLLWNPDADLSELIEDFTETYYGPAGKWIRAYVLALNRTAGEHPSLISAGPSRRSYRYLTPDFLREAKKLFDQAEKSVAADQILLRRVRTARLSSYYAQIIFSDDMNLGEDLKPLLEKYRQAYFETMVDRLVPGRLPHFENWWQQFSSTQLSFKATQTPASALEGVSPDDVYVFTARDFSLAHQPVADVSAAAGVAGQAKVGKVNPGEPQTPANSVLVGVVDLDTYRWLVSDTIPLARLSDGYQLLKIGRSKLALNCQLFVTESCQIHCPSITIAELQDPYDVYVSMKKAGKGLIAVDRMVLARVR